MFIYYFPQKIYLKIFFVIYLFSIWLFHFFLLILLPPSPYFITWKNAIFFLISSESTLFFLFYCMEIFFFRNFACDPCSSLICTRHIIKYIMVEMEETGQFTLLQGLSESSIMHSSWLKSFLEIIVCSISHPHPLINPQNCSSDFLTTT